MSMSLSELASKLHQSSSQVEPTATREMQRLAQVGVGLCKSTIQSMHAVDTGTMLNSTEAQQNGNEYLIGPTVDYATYVALGTSRMAARPFHIVAADLLSQEATEFGFDPKDLGL